MGIVRTSLTGTDAVLLKIRSEVTVGITRARVSTVPTIPLPLQKYALLSLPGVVCTTSILLA